jgi:hypothetical protein
MAHVANLARVDDIAGEVRFHLCAKNSMWQSLKCQGLATFPVLRKI